MNRRFLAAGVILLGILLPAGCTTKEGAKKPIPENRPAAFQTLQETAEKDPYRQGCVSCHKKSSEVDRSLPAYVERIAGHPKVTEGTVNACYKCHEAQRDYNLYKRFLRGIHRTHWRSEAFYDSKGTCYSCHTVETNGVAGIKNYPLAGYRAGISGKTEQPKAEFQPQPKSEGKEAREKPPQTKEPAAEEKSGNGKLFDSEEVPAPTP